MTKDNQAKTALDFKVEVKKIEKLKTNFAAHIDDSREMCRNYCAYTVETGNSDLIRHLREAVPEDFRPRLDRFVLNHIPYKVKRAVVKDEKGNAVIDPETGKKTQKFSYVKDKKIEAEKGLEVFNVETFETPFDKYKPAPSEKEEKDLAAHATEYLRKLELLTDKAEELGSEFPIFSDVKDAMAKFHKRMSKLLKTGSDLDAVEPMDKEQEARARSEASGKIEVAA